MTTISKMAAPLTPTLKTIVPTPVIVEANDETEETSFLDKDFFVKNAPQNLKPYHIITGNIYPKN